MALDDFQMVEFKILRRRDAHLRRAPCFKNNLCHRFLRCGTATRYKISYRLQYWPTMSQPKIKLDSTLIAHENTFIVIKYQRTYRADVTF